MIDIGRTFVIGDIHGCYLEFSELLNKINGDFRTDRLILLGDTIDRGPRSLDVVRKLIELQQSFGSRQIILLRGNHEQMAVDYFRHGDRLWDYNGNEATIASFKAGQDDIREYLDVFLSWPLMHQDESAVYVHAGINPRVALDRQEADDLLFIREAFYKSRIKMPKTVIFGHTPTLFLTGRDFPIVWPDRIDIDTGCVYGGSLTGVQVKDGQVVSVHQVKNRARHRSGTET